MKADWGPTSEEAAVEAKMAAEAKSASMAKPLGSNAPEPARVVVTNVDIPFGSVLEIVFRFALAGIIVSLLFGLVGALVVGVFRAWSVG